MSYKLMIASPIRQKPAILQEFLRGLERLELGGVDCEYWFADDNDDSVASDLLQQFMAPRDGLLMRMEDRPEPYDCNEVTHAWKLALIARVATIKNFMLTEARERGFDGVLLVDSDIVLHPHTLQHLLSLDKPIVSEVFWTRWQPHMPMLPQVWITDQYTLHELASGEQLQPGEVAARTRAFMHRMRDGNCHEVGGLGACTLIGARALEAGVNFDPVRNLSFWGEDRAFCVRAAVLGVSLWADTRYPPLHLYREEELQRVDRFWQRVDSNFERKPKLTLSMIVRNEADRYLRPMLQQMARLVDHAVIVDDCSIDDTVAVVHDCLAQVPHAVHRLDRSIFEHESALRRQQWNFTVQSNPDWILNLNADEMFEERAVPALRQLLQRPGGQLVTFQLFDFWTEGAYRDDPLWTAHQRWWPMLTRYTPDFHYTWNDNDLHCGRYPENIGQLPLLNCNLRIKHFGWMREEDRRAKYERYRRIDPDMQFSDRAQMESILDAQPTLSAWQE